ncbi:lysophospholipid acyltransferase family protein [Mobilicoccus sp.]|uniref:lysophospholipid acyltransferase family protein n=1 Tax=Mobilicoccus sp. TaxID=2034349 RepID=UPI0028A8F4EA|nr:lysophospholipid acyltransferase family protein [Mobilicoccus sp.]
MEPVYTPVIGLARTLFALEGLRFRVTGHENIPRKGGAVTVINHLSYLDFTYAGLAAQPSGRLIRFMCKDTIFDHPIAGPLMRGMKHIPVDRENGSASFRLALKALKDGELVGVFPEATISRSFELKEFKSGAVRMAQAARVPMIPIVLWGSQRVWTKGRPKRLGRTNTPISLDVGTPIDVPRDADAEQVLAELHDTMAAMLRAAQEVYPTVPFEERERMPVRLGGTAPTLDEATALDREEARLRREKKLSRGADGGDPAEVAAQP